MEETREEIAGKKLALLSNVNMDYVIRLIRKRAQIWPGEGYGNELGMMTNPASSYNAYKPDITFLVLDIMELLEHDLDPEAAEKRVDAWFAVFGGALLPERLYYISDACLWGPELAVLAEPGRKTVLEQIWQQRLEELCASRGNVRILPYHQLLEKLGEETAFSEKMWYMGRIPLGNEAQRRLCKLILDKVKTECRTPKKVLLLDLDNTLWGGLTGEREHTPVELSEEHGGLAYKNEQRVLLQMQKQGVLLGIVSKNNEADALAILEGHPHMVLKPEAFAIRRINWRQKHENILEIARELNLGLDSFVFWDDSPQERQLVKELLPQVEVPDFPERKEDLPSAMAEIYHKYFEKPLVTKEDLSRTAQYAANTARKELQASAGSFGEYLRQLEIKAVRVDPKAHMDRLIQLMNKTNQFNMTTRRYTTGEMARLLEDPGRKIFLYRVSDRFGDNGIVAAAITDLRGNVPVLTDFCMSCRVMGRHIEDALVEDMEKDLGEKGFGRLRALFLPTAKNHPAADLYERLGYRRLTEEELAATGDSGGQIPLPGQHGERGEAAGEDISHGTEGNRGTEEPEKMPRCRTYEISLANRPRRMYYVEMEDEEMER